MKLIFGLFLLSSAMCLSQTSAAAPAPAPPSAGTHTPHPDMGGMSDKHAQEMKAQIEKMRATLEQMKTNASQIKDPSARQEAQANADLWGGMIEHMEAMANMMSDHHDMGMMDGMPGGMDCCAKTADMKEGGCCGGGQCMKKTENRPAPSGNVN